MEEKKWEEKPTDNRFRKPAWVKKKEEREKWIRENISDAKPVKVPKPYILGKEKETKEKYVNENEEDKANEGP